MVQVNVSQNEEKTKQENLPYELSHQRKDVTPGNGSIILSQINPSLLTL